MCLQEIRGQIIPNTPSYNFVCKLRKVNLKGGNRAIGGGVAIGIHKSLVFKNLENLIPETLKESEI